MAIVNLAFKTFSVCQWRILIIIIVLYVYMYSIWKIFNLTLPKDFNRSSRFFWGWLLPCELFVSTFYFKTTQIQFLCISDFHKWSPVYPALARRIHYWQTSKRLNNSILQFCYLEFPALPYVVPITTVSSYISIVLIIYHVHKIV